MRDRHVVLVATIATGAIFACSDAAVEEVTAPHLAATPATPVANSWPWVEQYAAAGIPSAIGLQITTSPRFEYDYQWFVVDGRVQFQWANEVSASVKAWLINKAGVTVNSGSAGAAYRRLALPVPSGDTTFTVRISTNGVTCGLTGKNSYEGRARQNALNITLIEVVLFHSEILTTNGQDVSQPACPPPDECQGPATRVIGGATGILASVASDCEDAPAPPGGGSDPIEVCYTVWREYWYYDYLTRRTYLVGRWPVGTVCYSQ